MAIGCRVRGMAALVDDGNPLPFFAAAARVNDVNQVPSERGTGRTATAIGRGDYKILERSSMPRGTR